MQDKIKDFINRRTWAIVGYSDDASKYGHRIFHDLTRAGYHVHPVNPKGGTASGVRIHESVAELPEGIEVVDFVIPADIGLEVIQQCADNGLTRVWLQPGAESQDLIRKGQDLNLELVYNHCVMVEKRHWPSWIRSID